MSASEKAWAAGFTLSLLGIIGWLNAAATVDLGGLAPGLAAGNGRILGFVEVAVLALIVMIVAAVHCWFGNARAFLGRGDRPISGEAPPESRLLHPGGPGKVDRRVPRP